MSTDPTQQSVPPAPPGPAPEFCAHCGTKFKEGAVFCEMCGAVRPSIHASPPASHMDWRNWALQARMRQSTVSPTNWRAVIKAMLSVSMLTVVFTIIAGLITLIYGVGLVVPFILNQGYAHTVFFILPFFVTVGELTGYPLLVYYFFVIAAIVASCTWVLLVSYKTFMKEMTMKATSREHSPLFDISGLTFVNVFVSVLIVLIAMLFGVGDTNTPIGGSLQENLLELANAAVWEEIIVRVLLIGVPLLIIDVIRRKMRKDWYAYILGGKFKFGLPEVALVLISATIFGYAHYLGGWGAWKIPAAAIGGVAFGYLFLKYGLPAAIVMHFATDYASMPADVFGFSQVPIEVVLLLWLGLGIAFFIYYILRISEFISGRRLLDPKPQPVQGFWPQPWQYQQTPMYAQPPYPPVQNPPYQPPPYQYPPPPPPSPGQEMPPVVPQQAHYGGYVCPSCGYMEARWVNGRFQCLRCGRLS